MKMARKQHSCIVCNKTTLYAIGGTDDQYGTTAVERILFDNITNRNWFDSAPVYTLLSSRAVLYDDTILVIGGFYYGAETYTYIQSINCLDTAGTVTSFSPSQSLHDKIYATAVVYITFSHTIFAFGGYNGSNVPDDSVASWQYIELPTNFPTNAPTITPTVSSLSPTTTNPTEVTLSPTTLPTNNPTLNPTINPSNAPTNPTPKPVTLIDRDPTQSPGNRAVLLSTTLIST
eukprot:UN04798